jgi:hypothetical protein
VLVRTGPTSYVIDHCNFQNSVTYGAYLQCINSPGSGDHTIINCTFSGAPTDQLHIKSGGGLRVVNNKFNGGSQGIYIDGSVATTQGIAPLIITGNSIEGASFGILAQRPSGTEAMGAFAITGNEINCSAGIVFQASVSAPATPFAAGYRVQADALLIEAGARSRLADEYDAAQDRGEVATAGQPSIVPVGNDKPATAEQIGLSRKDVHEARIIRDAEVKEPGIISRALDQMLKANEEPTRAKDRLAYREAARPNQPERDRPLRIPPQSRKSLRKRSRSAIHSRRFRRDRRHGDAMRFVSTFAGQLLLYPVFRPLTRSPDGSWARMPPPLFLNIFARPPHGS